jgi:hypothetical protein
MTRTVALPTIAAAALALFAAQASAEGNSTSEKMNPPQNTSTKNPAGVADPTAVQNDTQGMHGAETGCKSASAEMTAGKVENCKQ